MLLMHGAPLAVDLAQTHRQSEFARFPLGVDLRWIRARICTSSFQVSR
jgi:hypothetical protein